MAVKNICLHQCLLINILWGMHKCIPFLWDVEVIVLYIRTKLIQTTPFGSFVNDPYRFTMGKKPAGSIPFLSYKHPICRDESRFARSLFVNDPHTRTEDISQNCRGDSQITRNAKGMVTKPFLFDICIFNFN